MFSYQSHGKQLSPFVLLDYASPAEFSSVNRPRGGNRDIPAIALPDGASTVRVISGNYKGHVSPAHILNAHESVGFSSESGRCL